MTNHFKQESNDDVYASIELSQGLPKDKFPQKARQPRNVFNAIRDELMLDGNLRQNLATFCQTWLQRQQKPTKKANKRTVN